MTQQQRRPRQQGQRPQPVPAEDKSEQSPIKFRISRDMLRQLLRLHPGVDVLGASYDPASGLIEFDLDIPSAPEGAEELLVSYRHTGKPDPIYAQSTWRERSGGAA